MTMRTLKTQCFDSEVSCLVCILVINLYWDLHQVCLFLHMCFHSKQTSISVSVSLWSVAILNTGEVPGKQAY